MNMKHLLATGMALLLLCSSCSDFFKESSQDEIKPSSMDDLKSVMYKNAYPYLFNWDNYLNLLTDQVQSNGQTADTYASFQQNGTPVFNFNPAMFDGTEPFPEEANSWKNYYERIMGCNVIYDYIDKVSGSEADKKSARGQVLFLRAFYNLKLALIYCQIYNGKDVNPDTTPGIPLMLSMEVTDKFPKRNTLGETYAQIEKDLQKAKDLLQDDKTVSAPFRITHTAVELLLSRMYLYMGRDEDLDNVIKYATMAIEDGPTLTNLYSFKSKFGDKSIYDTDVSPEVVWVYGSSSIVSTAYWSTSTITQTMPPYTISTSLYNMYDQTNDLRYKLYMRGGGANSLSGNPLFVMKKGSINNNYGDHGLRMAEAYLNRAEALIRQYKKDGDAAKRTQALQDLNALRKSRYDEGTYTPLDITDADLLLQTCLDERQREFCWEEGLRWFDIKRLQLSITHQSRDAEGNVTTYTLKENDPLYALPIPHDALMRNTNLEQNPR